jgi:hypothetical protein
MTDTNDNDDTPVLTIRERVEEKIELCGFCLLDDNRRMAAKFLREAADILDAESDRIDEGDRQAALPLAQPDDREPGDRPGIGE